MCLDLVLPGVLYRQCVNKIKIGKHVVFPEIYLFILIADRGDIDVSLAMVYFIRRKS